MARVGDRVRIGHRQMVGGRPESGRGPHPSEGDPAQGGGQLLKGADISPPTGARNLRGEAHKIGLEQGTHPLGTLVGKGKDQNQAPHPLGTLVEIEIDPDLVPLPPDTLVETEVGQDSNHPTARARGASGTSPSLRQAGWLGQVEVLSVCEWPCRGE